MQSHEKRTVSPEDLFLRRWEILDGGRCSLASQDFEGGRSGSFYKVDDWWRRQIPILRFLEQVAWKESVLSAIGGKAPDADRPQKI